MEGESGILIFNYNLWSTMWGAVIFCPFQGGWFSLSFSFLFLSLWMMVYTHKLHAQFDCRVF